MGTVVRYPQTANLPLARSRPGRYRAAPVHPSPDAPPPADATRSEPPRSWLAVAALLEQHGFGELVAPGEVPFGADDDDR